MMEIQFGNLEQLKWLALVTLVLVIAVMAAVYHRRLRKRFATSNLIGSLFPRRASIRQLVKSVAAITAMTLLVMGLVDVRWGQTWREVPQRGSEVMFVLDVSRSMLATDVSPNRLERAKLQINDMIDEMAGDRVGLVLFSGEAKQQIPLTSHYHDFKTLLAEVGPYNVPLGGSRLGNAIAFAAESFLSKTNDHKAIVVFTDGEDQESHPVEVARRVFREKGIRIFTVGLGDMRQGSRIPTRTNRTGGEYLEHDGQQVWSKLDGEILKQVSLESGGAYVPAGTSQVDMGSVYHRFVSTVGQEDFETARINAYVPRFQYFVAAALIVMMLELFWPRRAGKQVARSVFGLQKPVNQKDLSAARDELQRSAA